MLTDTEIDRIAARIFELILAEYSKRESAMVASLVESFVNAPLPFPGTDAIRTSPLPPGFPYYVTANPTITTKQFYGEREDDNA